MPTLPSWILTARSQWKFRGHIRPSFAEPTAEGQESVWDYPRPPRIESDGREVTVKQGDCLIAESRRAVRVLETASPPAFYLPRDDVQPGLLQPSDRHSLCEWKGAASYWSVTLPGGESIHNAAWSYEEPFPEFASIAGYVSFYPALVECYLAGERAAPQPGRLYGGWVTSEVVGPFKGTPGTEAW